MKHMIALGLLAAAALSAAPLMPQAEKSQVANMTLKAYRILKTYDPAKNNEGYEWALRANIIVDKQGIIQFVEEGDDAVDPNTALTMCTTLHKKDAAK